MSRIEWQFVKPGMVVKSNFWEAKILKEPVYNQWMEGRTGECTAEVEVLSTTVDTLKIGQTVTFAATLYTTFELVSEN